MQATWKLPDRHEVTHEVAEGLSLMEAAVARGVPGIIGECGGSMSCATCHVVVDPAWATKAGAWAKKAGEVGLFEADMLDITEAERQPTSRLSCQIRMRAELDRIVARVPQP